MKLTVDREKADARFIYYFFSSREAVQKILNQNSSSAVPHINLTSLRNFIVPVPQRRAQQRIADILSSYDDLIENNRRRIAFYACQSRLCISIKTRTGWRSAIEKCSWSQDQRTCARRHFREHEQLFR